MTKKKITAAGLMAKLTADPKFGLSATRRRLCAWRVLRHTAWGGTGAR